MQTPRDVVEMRFARGEITAEERSSILSHLGPPSLPTTAPQGPPPLPASSAKRIWAWIGGGVASLVVLVLVVAFLSTEGLNIGNLSAVGTTVRFKLGNNSSRGGDVLLWIEQDDMRKCEHVTQVRSQLTYDVTFACPTLQNGKFMVRWQWAEYAQDIAATAIRIQ